MLVCESCEVVLQVGSVLVCESCEVMLQVGSVSHATCGECVGV